ncbi:MAG TPA: hypothetical protein VG934_01435 [Candidatus Paceibacterota bacterium]|nr:hypothetical protein [Candidatus Paceibacterota bacterium]
MKKIVCGCAALALMALCGMTPAYAGSAASDWNNSEGFPSADQDANRFNEAQALWLYQNGGGSTTYNSTSTTNTYTNCTVATACQYGGESTNLNGVSVTTIDNAQNIHVDNDIHAQSQQNATSVPISAGNVGSITFP